MWKLINIGLYITIPCPDETEPGKSHELHSSNAEMWNRGAKGTKTKAPPGVRGSEGDGE